MGLTIGLLVLIGMLFLMIGMIFEKGSGIIEKTFRKEELEKNYQINAYTDEMRHSRKSLKSFL